MSTEICHPTEETWFICFATSGKLVVKAYASFNTNECMETPWDTIEQYTSQQEWEDRLEEYGITILFPPI
ncbi:MAG TPA: hypothetical protein EYO58_06130 [Flavobacteriales bacterium]|nr:hypothetical protein [Flavobacteriales bacterium]HIB77189.1 hypothetical protein [Flavobacteriales bacterium]